MIVLPASLATAAACGLINLWLALRVGQMRRLHQVSIGDGGNPAVIARMRAHANFAEFAPIVLLLLALLELANGTSALYWACGAAFVAARVAHGLGMDSWKPGRGIGIVGTMLVLLLLVALAAWTAFDRDVAGAMDIPIESVPAA